MRGAREGGGRRRLRKRRESNVEWQKRRRRPRCPFLLPFLLLRLAPARTLVGLADAMASATGEKTCLLLSKKERRRRGGVGARAPCCWRGKEEGASEPASFFSSKKMRKLDADFHFFFFLLKKHRTSLGSHLQVSATFSLSLQARNLLILQETAVSNSEQA